MTRTRMKRTRTTNGAFDKATKELAFKRSGGLCECCACPVGVWQAHHRRSRSAGGSRRASTSSVANCAVLHPHCHAWLEAHPDAAHKLGLMVRQSWEPTDVAVSIGGKWVLFTEFGTYQPLPEEA